MCGPSGAVAFPHQRCTTTDELKRLCVRLPTDPLVLKAYTERGLASLLDRWHVMLKENKLSDGFKKNVVPPEKRFADLSELNHATIRGYACEILETISQHGDDEMVKAFCECRDSAEGNVFPQFNLTEMLFSNAYAFPGSRWWRMTCPRRRCF